MKKKLIVFCGQKCFQLDSCGKTFENEVFKISLANFNPFSKKVSLK